jgi:hypothetical protein
MLTPERIEQERVRFERETIQPAGVFWDSEHQTYTVINQKNVTIAVHHNIYFRGWLAAIEAQEKSGGADGNFWHLSHDENEIANSEDIEVLQDAVLNLYEDIRCLKEDMQAQEIKLPIFTAETRPTQSVLDMCIDETKKYIESQGFKVITK